MAQQQEVTLTTVFAERLYEVPDYQRPYAWGRKQLRDLWEDLDLLGPDKQHYAGTLVLKPVVGDSGAPATESDQSGAVLQRVDVVDGQQRLTTCLILIDRLRRCLDTLEADSDEARDRSDHLRRTFGLVRIDGALRPRLALASDLAPIWTDAVLGDSPVAQANLTGGQRRLLEACAFFDERLSELTTGEDLDIALSRLADLQKRVTNGLRFLVYEVVSLTDVGVIFETLNERGRPLSDLEKTKNYLLYLARQIPDARAEQLAQLINERWRRIFEHLAMAPRGEEDQLLRWHWLATQDSDRRNWNGVASIKARFDRGSYLPGEVRLKDVGQTGDAEDLWDALFADLEGYITTLASCALFLREFSSSEAVYVDFPEEKRGRVRDNTAALRRTRVTALYRPLIFACRLARPTDADTYADLLDLCERYSARVFLIQQRRSNAGEQSLYGLARQLLEGVPPAEILEKLRAVLWRYAPDAAVTETVEAAELDWYHRQGHKYVLYEYELSMLAAGEEVKDFPYFIEKGNVQRTTEHILPQTPRQGEKGDCWRDLFSPEQHAELVHSLGNLVLTLDNSVYSNKCFGEKRGEPAAPGSQPSPCYAQGKLHQERELAHAATWGPDDIRARHERLATWMVDRWAVVPPGTQAQLQDDEVHEVEEEALDAGEDEM